MKFLSGLQGLNHVSKYGVNGKDLILYDDWEPLGPQLCK